MVQVAFGAGHTKDELHAHPKKHVYEGRFETNGDAAAVNAYGKGVTKIAFLGTGQYRVELDRAYAEFLHAEAWVMQASSGAAAAIVLPASLEPGDRRTKASFIVETHSALGTEANLDGPVVGFRAVLTDDPTGTGPSLTDET